MPTLSWTRLGAASLGLLLAAPSLAGRAATVTVDNSFDGAAEVRIDGNLVGLVDGDHTASFAVTPGLHAIQVMRSGSGFLLAATASRLDAGCTLILPVEPPRGEVQVLNRGEVALKLDLDRSSVWLQPGASVLVPVTTGNVTLGASIRDPRGEFRAIERSLWVEPGLLATTTLAPDPTVVAITNRDRVPLRALIDGADGGWVQPGDTARIWVRPGPTAVVLEDRAGRVVSRTSVVVGRGDDARVIVAAPQPPPPRVVVVTGR